MSLAVEAQDLFRVHSTPEGDAAALQGLTLNVEEGEILTVLGPSGAGKTSFLRILAGLDLPSAEDADRPGRGKVEAGEDPQERGLARTARPEHGQDLALGDAQGQALQRGRVPARYGGAA